MKEFEDIRELWKKQGEAPVNYNEIIKSIEADQKGYARKLIIQSLSVLIALALIICIWLFKPFSTWTTHLSMLILCACLFYFLIMQLRDYKNVSKFDQLLLKPQDFIEYLKEYKQTSYLLNKRNYKIYSIGIGLAFLFILFEMYFIVPFWLLLLFALMAFGWFVLSYLFLMKEYIKSENRRVETMIDQLEKIKKQLRD